MALSCTAVLSTEEYTKEFVLIELLPHNIGRSLRPKSSPTTSNILISKRYGPPSLPNHIQSETRTGLSIAEKI
jgi:hypothetical protein